MSSHCLATLSAKMSEFNRHKRQNAYYRNLKQTFEDSLPCEFLRNKAQQQNYPIASFSKLLLQAKEQT